MALLLYHLRRPDAGTDQDRGNGIKEFSQHSDTPTVTTTHRQRMLAAIDLRNDFAEKQQQESQEHGDDQELQPPGSPPEVDEVLKEIGTEHDDGHIHQIIRNQNRG